MFRHLVVPVDGSHRSFAAVPVAARMADAVGGKVEIATVVDRLADVAKARAMLERGVDQFWPLAQEPAQIVLAGDSVAGALKHHIEESQGGVLLMSSEGHNRSMDMLSRTTDEVLRAMFGPVIMIGPRAGDCPGTLDGAYVVPLDGSTRADGVLPIVAAWSKTYGAVPWLIEVVGEREGREIDDAQAQSIADRASGLQRRTGAPVAFDLIRSRNTCAAIVACAEEQLASLIFLATHGSTGMEWLRSGSTAVGVLQQATCPVVMFRPPELAARQVPERANAA
jgi:nucleotide-binding universal stress UspA family protein